MGEKDFVHMVTIWKLSLLNMALLLCPATTLFLQYPPTKSLSTSIAVKMTQQIPCPSSSPKWEAAVALVGSGCVIYFTTIWYHWRNVGCVVYFTAADHWRSVGCHHFYEICVHLSRFSFLSGCKVWWNFLSSGKVQWQYVHVKIVLKLMDTYLICWMRKIL